MKVRVCEHHVNGKPLVLDAEARIDVRSPHDQAHITTIPDGGEAAVGAAVDAAAKAFASGVWAKVTARERARVLNRAASLLRERIQTLAALESVQTGRVLKEMRAQLARLPEWIEHFAGLAQGLEGSVPPFSDANHLNYVTRLPLGVCGLITPWNHPLLIAVKKLAPALAAGNSVVLKPSELAPASLLELAELFEEAGLPAGVLNVVCGLGATAGKALAEHPGIAKLDLTGGTETGRIASAAASRSLARVCMELGGNAPVLIFDDAHLEQAVNGVAFGAFVASGQTCVSAKRVLVQRGVADAFTERLVAKARSLKLGAPDDASTQMGPLVSERQMARVLELIGTAEPEGAKILCGGRRSPLDECAAGWYVEPTVIGSVQPHFACFQEEIFGPCVTVVPFDDEAQALALANDSRFGLGAAIWTRDVARAHRVARDLRAGVIWVNAHHRNDPSSPWGGFGESGVGRENGWEALVDYTESKSVCVSLDDTPFDWFGGAKRYG